MTEFLGRPFPQKVQRGLRRLEAKIMPKAAQEREVYEKQEQALFASLESPEFQQEIAGIRGSLDNLLPASLRPKREDLEKLTPTNPKLYSRFGKMATSSDHTVAHQIIVGELNAINTISMQQQALIEDPHIDTSLFARDQEYAYALGLVHDVRRRGDTASSVPPFVLSHGIASALRLPTLLADVNANPEITSDRVALRNGQLALAQHDIAFKTVADFFGKPKELTSLKTADAATMGRLTLSHSAIVRAASGILADRRMRQYSTRKNTPISKGYFDNLIRVAGGIDILVRREIAQLKKEGHTITPDFLARVTLDVSEALGVIQPKEVHIPQEEKAA